MIISFARYKWSKLAKLHRYKERKPPSLSNQPRVCAFSLKVAWSGISLFAARGGGATKREGGGHVKFYPYGKGGGGKSFSHGEG